MPEPTDRPVLTVAEVAEILGVPKQHLYRQIKAGTFPSLSLGERKVVVPTAELRRFLGIDPPLESAG